MTLLKDTIVGIYAYTNINWDGATDKKRFYLAYCFSDDGLLGSKLLKEIYDHTFLKDTPLSGNSGPFEEFAEMVKFSLKLCEVQKKGRCILISIEHYNTSLEKSLELEELLQHILKKGSLVENPGRKKDWKLLGRIFN